MRVHALASDSLAPNAKSAGIWLCSGNGIVVSFTCDDVLVFLIVAAVVMAGALVAFVDVLAINIFVDITNIFYFKFYLNDNF